MLVVVADVTAIGVALAVVRALEDLDDLNIALLGISVLIVMAASSAYRVPMLSGLDEYRRVFVAATYSIVVFVVLAGLREGGLAIDRNLLLVTSTALIGSLILERFLLRRVVSRLRARGLFLYDAVIAGASSQGIAIAQQFAMFRTSGMRLVGFLDDYAPRGTQIFGDVRVLGPAELADEPFVRGVDFLIVVPHALSWEGLQYLVRVSSRGNGPTVLFSPGMYDVVASGAAAVSIGNVPLLATDRSRIVGIEALLKAVLDMAFAIPASAVVLAVLLVRRLFGRRPLVAQVPVIGRHHRSFGMFVWPGAAAAEIPRGFGRAPAVLNVVRGEMSLVGPRPVRADHPDAVGLSDILLSVKPGVTGLLPQGESEANLIERRNLDVWYVRNYTIWLDILALVRALRHTVIRKRARSGVPTPAVIGRAQSTSVRAPPASEPQLPHRSP